MAIQHYFEHSTGAINDNRGCTLPKSTAATIMGDFSPLVEYFDKLVQHKQNGHTILAASDGSYLKDGQASAGWAFYEPSEEYDGDGRLVPSVKIHFGDTILVDSRLDSNSTYQAKAVGIFTVTIDLTTIASAHLAVL